MRRLQRGRLVRPTEPIDLDLEEKRQRMVDNRWRRFFGPVGLVSQFEGCGDPLIELHDIAVLLASVSTLPYEQIVRRFVASVKLGAFPVPGTGFRYFGDDRRAVCDLVDLHNFNQFAAGQYVLRPSVLTVQMTPMAMRARRSTWVRWLTTMGWPIPPELMPESAPAPNADADAGAHPEPPQDPPETPRRRGPQRNTINRLRREREALIPMLQKAQQELESPAETIRRLLKEEKLKLPGNGTLENMIEELARVWRAQPKQG